MVRAQHRPALRARAHRSQVARSQTNTRAPTARVRSHAAGVRLDFDHQVGNITCDSCRATYEMQINRLTEPIDVYSEWMDMAEQVNSGDVATAGGEDEDEED